MRLNTASTRLLLDTRYSAPPLSPLKANPYKWSRPYYTSHYRLLTSPNSIYLPRNPKRVGSHAKHVLFSFFGRDVFFHLIAENNKAHAVMIFYGGKRKIDHLSI